MKMRWIRYLAIWWWIATPDTLRIQFASLLSYVPQKKWDQCPATVKRSEIEKGKKFMCALKNNRTLSDHPRPFPEMVVERCADVMRFDDFFVKNAILVPIPGHEATKSKPAVVPGVIADSLKQRGLGGDVIPCLERTESVPQSSKCDPKDRPTVMTHYATMRIKNSTVLEPRDVLLVDDVVTTGSTITAAYKRTAEAYPNAHIRAFAAMNASFPDEFRQVKDPRTGTIMYAESSPQKLFND